MSMKIGSDRVSKLNNEFIQKDLKKIKQNEEDTSSFAGDDKVELSSQAMDLKKMQQQAMSTPDVRTEKVDNIKLQVDNGNYKINTEQIAEKLIQEGLE